VLKVRVNRTEAIDAMMEGVRQARNRPLREPPAKYVDQMRALKRKTEIAAQGYVKRFYESTGSQGDDYAHAEVYDLVATEVLRMQQQIAAMQESERPVADEEVGFQRVRLGADDGGYRPGFGGEGERRGY
jgi:hypothetical protein